MVRAHAILFNSRAKFNHQALTLRSKINTYLNLNELLLDAESHKYGVKA